ncbi:hypothetical protein CspeluHIS016_0109290 [Cutaneotrichosporon spelunceum]|uniref:NADP-dependent oxidoreductase domain-containing protein n=1 Tax=Cutaneotrichosporon spelunceum TaxID=1672016 RepID=A0AAD3TNX8_9TREE|nr:hypothetical protein CspeluHIS016_0109290 [Cutaneotrichosporon spelunceum]
MSTTSNSKHKMQYVRLGNSGLKVSRLILGCMSYGTPTYQSWILDEKTGIEHIKHAYSRGINTFDTANVYANGASEIVLGKAIKAIGCPREAVVVLTKCYFPVGKLGEAGSVGGPADKNSPEGANGSGLSRKHIFGSIKASLERLQLDYVDVLQCHRFDYDTPIEETMQALHDVVQAGYARYIGMSSCHAYQFHQMQNYAINNRLTPFISMQNYHNGVYREEEREMVPTLKVFGTGMIPWSPLARGFLTRPWDTEEGIRQKTDAAYKTRKLHLPTDAMKAINERIAELAKKKGVGMAQIALAWQLSCDFVTAPIVGSTRLEALDELIDAVDMRLTPDEKAYIDEPYVPQAIIGHT